MHGAVLFSVVGSLVLGGLPGPAAEEPIEVEGLECLGFSMNEAEVAWSVNVRAPHQGGELIDRYVLASVVDLYTQARTGMYRLTEIRRSDRAGARLDRPEAILAATNAPWREALPLAEWRKVARGKGFAARKLRPESGLVRILPDRDVTLTASARDGAIDIVAPSGMSLGYTPMLKLLSGVEVPLGHTRLEGRAGVAMRARVELFVSATGIKVALIHRIASVGATRGSVVAETIYNHHVERLPSPVVAASLGDGGVLGGTVGSPANSNDVLKQFMRDYEEKRKSERKVNEQPSSP